MKNKLKTGSHKAIAYFRKKGYNDGKVIHNLCTETGRSVYYVLGVYRSGA